MSSVTKFSLCVTFEFVQQHSLNPGNGPPPPNMMPMPGGAGPDGIPVTGPHPMFYSSPHFGPRPFGPRPAPLRNMSPSMVRKSKSRDSLVFGSLLS